MEEDNEIKVSISCMAYNEEKYIAKCLESLVTQKTNFKYEIIVHDDASTDNTANIIREFEKKYPDKIVAIYEEENQYSKHVSTIKTILLPRIRGKYIAFCEGDDYWCDENKLQKQFDYMEQHPECSMCVHNTIIHDLSGKNPDKKFNNYQEIHKMTGKEVFFGWNVHTTSYFEKAEYLQQPKLNKRYWFGDYIRLTMAYYYGDVVVFPDVMSVYNAHNKIGLTNTIAMQKDRRLQRIDYLKEYNEITNHKFDEIVKLRINDIDFNEMLIEGITNVSTKQDFKNLKKKIKEHDYYKEYLNNLTNKEKLKFLLKYNCYYVFKIVKNFKKD